MQTWTLHPTTTTTTGSNCQSQPASEKPTFNGKVLRSSSLALKLMTPLCTAFAYELRCKCIQHSTGYTVGESLIVALLSLSKPAFFGSIVPFKGTGILKGVAPNRDCTPLSNYTGRDRERESMSRIKA